MMITSEEHDSSEVVGIVSGSALKRTVQVYTDSRPKSAGSTINVRQQSGTIPQDRSNKSFVQHIRSLKSYNESEVNRKYKLVFFIFSV